MNKYTIPVIKIPVELRNALCSVLAEAAGPHGSAEYQREGALREGRTIYVRDIRIHKTNYELAGVTKLPHVLKRLSEFVGLPVVKCYYHELAPDQRIYEHADTGHYFDYVQRYQIFTNVPPEFIIHHGGEQQTAREWFLHLFQQSVPHAYYNGSTTPVGFYVFDCVWPEHQSKFKEIDHAP